MVSSETRRQNIRVCRVVQLQFSSCGRLLLTRLYEESAANSSTISRPAWRTSFVTVAALSRVASYSYAQCPGGAVESGDGEIPYTSPVLASARPHASVGGTHSEENLHRCHE